MNAPVDVLAQRGKRPFVNVRFADGSRCTLFNVRRGPGGFTDEAVPVLRHALAAKTVRAFAEGALLRNGKTVPYLWLPDDLRAELSAAVAALARCGGA